MTSGGSTAYKCLDKVINSDATSGDSCDSLCNGQGDPYPTLMLKYSCSYGFTSLSSVKVYNVFRYFSWTKQGSQEYWHLSYFTIEFLDADGISDRYVWNLNGNYDWMSFSLATGEFALSAPAPSHDGSALLLLLLLLLLFAQDYTADKAIGPG
jgi:hypothetical protein